MIQTTVRENDVVVTLSGRIDVQNAKDLEEQINNFVRKPRRASLCKDCRINLHGHPNRILPCEIGEKDK